MEKFDIENIPIVWAPNNLSGSIQETWKERFSGRVLLCVKELKNNKTQLWRMFDETIEDELKLYEEDKYLE